LRIHYLNELEFEEDFVFIKKIIYKLFPMRKNINTIEVGSLDEVAITSKMHDRTRLNLMNPQLYNLNLLKLKLKNLQKNQRHNFTLNTNVLRLLFAVIEWEKKLKFLRLITLRNWVMIYVWNNIGKYFWKLLLL
jgi:hypothetical protein